MSRFRYLVLALLAALTLAGCKSKKAVTMPPGHGNRPERPVMVTPSTPRQVASLVQEARKWIGTPYVYGGHSRSGTDCSGMIMEIFLKVYDIKLPRSSAMQQQWSRPVKSDAMEPGDLVFFTTGKSHQRVNHVGLYVGDGRMIHASASRGVMESSLAEKYWTNTFHSSGRVVEVDAKHPEKKPRKVIDTEPTDLRLQQLYDALDSQIDSLYVSDPDIFD